MKCTKKYSYETYEETISFLCDDSFSTYESSYTRCYERAAGYDSFTGMSDDLFDQMQRGFAINVNVACF